MKLILLLFCLCIPAKIVNSASNIPVVITTWEFYNATIKAWSVLNNGGIALDAVEQGASVCEELQCDLTVGYGGSPDEDGETTLDAFIMDGKTMNVGAVGALRRVKSAMSVARHVLEHTEHSFLAGELATKFAVQMGFKEESLSTSESKRIWKKWHNEDNCQPNFWMSVKPNPAKECGPYHKQWTDVNHIQPEVRMVIDKYNHDTIGMVAVDENGDVAAGTSSNGAKFKIPGRIGDAAIAGAGAYAENKVGGAAATGDGDVMLRFSPSFLAVEKMRSGASSTEAARFAIKRIASHYPSFSGAVIALSQKGDYGAACHGMQTFPYVVQDKTQDKYKIVTISCTKED